jgi:hypothetical protein
VPDCRVLLFSGHAWSQELAVAARDSGYEFGRLDKPIDPPEMVKRVWGCLMGGDVCAA